MWDDVIKNVTAVTLGINVIALMEQFLLQIMHIKLIFCVFSNVFNSVVCLYIQTIFVDKRKNWGLQMTPPPS